MMREVPSVQSAAMKRIVCLISGRGSNLAALLEAAHRERWAQDIPAGIALVLSNRAQALGLEIARQHGVATKVVEHRAYATREAFEAAMIAAIDAHAPQLVVLAGFMRVLTGSFVAHYAGRLLNVHPSLLPALPGLATHRRALEAGVRIHGATVHFVSQAVDGGPIVAQVAVPVRDEDDESSLAARVLAEEHRLLPRCVRWIVEGRVRLVGERIQVSGIGDAERSVMANEAR
jgi:phosphoribosylglycinamide formyltransferase-1